ncbi:PhoX family protein [Thalassospira indica]|uniref:PhoX family phosphatase n=1 Tax=Thalassospira indica TaxID=1891279 RepID=A0ABN5NFK2_9PROT|nr:PhoX family phosphatase [Thalassospira indica]AXO14045.1 PhoX family phosphatase [Thalassospira indica]OAZ12923.1 dTDP-glucose 4,6-dehydratase [Thalassospira profundimaris]
MNDKYEIIEDSDDIPSNPTNNPCIDDLINARFSRRGFFKGLMATSAVVGAGIATKGVAKAQSPSTLTFKSIPQKITETHAVADGYDASVLIRWGDKVVADAPAFVPGQVDANAQNKQFGYNCDYVGYMPLPVGSQNSDHGLLCVSHEYTNAELMWSGLKDAMDASEEQALHEIAAHGHSVIEVKKTGGKWQVVDGSDYARRISPIDTEMQITGPAAGHDRLKTNTDPTGTRVIGTLNNCAGGKTPWGTVLIAEENFNGYFGGDIAKTSEERNYKRLGISQDSWYSWVKYFDRFNVEKDPNEPNKFGWMVEIDPYDPTSMPKKRTALGRFKHEGATVIINKDNSVVAYSGDDQRFDYLYKFIAANKYNPNDRAANMDLLENGTLFVAQFHEDGSLDWMPLIFGEGPLTAENDFHSQADVLIEARRAADLLGATQMDRPEDVEPNPVNGKVYVMLTNNSKRKEGNAANPRAANPHGHVLELTPPGGRGKDADHTASRFTWDIMIAAGNPAVADDKAVYHPAAESWVSCPDNMAIDHRGRLWISTDGAPKSDIPDGMHATDVDGPGRALTKFFFACPVGAEMCGPEFTPDGKALFLAVQHPADGSSYDAPSTRWPDFQAAMPPRPSVVAVTKNDGGEIAG